MLDLSKLSSLTDVWQKLKESDEKILIYGIGNGCEKLLSAFEKEGIKAEGIFASDDHKKRGSFHGLPVYTYGEVRERYNKFTAVLAFGTELDDVMHRIEGIENDFTLLAPELSVADDSYFKKETFLARSGDVRKVYSLLADDRSRAVFESLCCFKITGELRYLREAFCDREDTFLNILKPTENESYLDLGAYNGDTVRELLQYTNGHYKKIYCFEPDFRNFRKLTKNLLPLDDIELENSAAWGSDTALCFSNSSGRQSAVSNTGKLTSARSVDSFLQGREVTFIKYDVEGADRQAILGSSETIKKYSPKICTAVYHRPYDFLDIPLLLNGISSRYSFYLRQYPYYPAWETELILVTK